MTGADIRFQIGFPQKKNKRILSNENFIFFGSVRIINMSFLLNYIDYLKDFSFLNKYE